jgi:hypothetical protein
MHYYASRQADARNEPHSTEVRRELFLKPPFKMCLAASLPTPRHSESSLVVIRTVLHHNGMSSFHAFIGPSGNWPAWTNIILQR